MKNITAGNIRAGKKGALLRDIRRKKGMTITAATAAAIRIVFKADLRLFSRSARSAMREERQNCSKSSSVFIWGYPC